MKTDDHSIMHAKPLPVGTIRTGFLLVDPCNLDQYSFPESLPMLRCTPPSLTNSDEVMPRLIDVAGLNQLQQEGLAEVLSEELRGERPPLVCAWLDCKLSAGALARHISRFLVGPSVEGTDVLWRYYDPRVFALAVTVLHKEQSQALLGPVLEWHFPWRNRWWSVIGPGVESEPVKGVTLAWPDAKQWDSLERAALVSQALYRLEGMHGRLTDEDCLRLLRKLDSLMALGKLRLHLYENDELVDYAVLSVRYVAEFRHHRKLTDAWLRLAQGDIRWFDLTALLVEKDFEEMIKYSLSAGLPLGVER